VAQPDLWARAEGRPGTKGRAGLAPGGMRHT